MRRLKVLTLTDQLVYLGGGAERVAMEIATRLDQSRFESIFCASRYWDGLRLDSVQEAERRMDEAGVRYFGLGRRSPTDLYRWLSLRGILRRERVDVLHAHMFGSNVWGTMIGRLARVPVIVAHEHTWSFEGRPLRRLVDREVIGRGSSVFIAVSRDDRRKMIEIEGVDPKKILHVPNGIAPPPPPSGADVRAELGIPAGAPVIGTVSVLRPQKALDVFIRASAQLLGEDPDLRVLLAGDGPLRGELTELVHSLGVQDRLLMLGLPLGRVRRDGGARRGGLVVGLRGQPAGGDGVHGVGPADRGDPRGRRPRPDRGRRARAAGRARATSPA